MISITTSSPGTNDAIIIKNYKSASQLRQASARISKTKTLDGGVVVMHNGFADGDRAINVNAILSKTETDILWNIFTTQTFITVAIEDGVFNAVIKSLKIKGKIQMTIEFESKLS
jgi:uncharacterized Rossmann fold enzyme